VRGCTNPNAANYNANANFDDGSCVFAPKQPKRKKKDRSAELLAGLNTAANQGTRTAGGIATGARAIAGTGILGRRAFKFSRGKTAGKIVAGAALADAVSGAGAGAIQGVSTMVRGAADVGSKIAQNDGFGALTSATKSAAAAMEGIPVVGKPLAATLGVITTSFEAVKSVVDSFVDRGKELTAFSGKIASAVALAEAARLRRDIREANKMGDSFAKLIIAQEKSEAAFNEALMPLKAALAEFVNKLLVENNDEIKTTLKVIAGAVEGTWFVLKNSFPVLKLIYTLLVKIFGSGPVKVKIEEQLDTDASAQIIEWVNGLAGLDLGDGEKERARAADANRAIAIPALK